MANLDYVCCGGLFAESLLHEANQVQNMLPCSIQCCGIQRHGVENFHAALAVCIWVCKQTICRTGCGRFAAQHRRVECSVRHCTCIGQLFFIGTASSLYPLEAGMNTNATIGRFGVFCTDNRRHAMAASLIKTTFNIANIV